MRRTSVLGVNHRSPNRGAAAAAELESRRRKAVWDRLNSVATACIHRASAARSASSRTHTDAGLPLNGSAVKASTCDDHTGDSVTPHAKAKHQCTMLLCSVPLLFKYP